MCVCVLFKTFAEAMVLAKRARSDIAGSRRRRFAASPSGTGRIGLPRRTWAAGVGLFCLIVTAERSVVKYLERNNLWHFSSRAWAGWSRAYDRYKMKNRLAIGR